jgi:hypothetical protein
MEEMRFRFFMPALLAAVAGAMLLARPASAGPVTSEDLVKAGENAGEWLMYGRDYRNWRYSPLAEITPENANKLTRSGRCQPAASSEGSNRRRFIVTVPYISRRTTRGFSR